MDYMKNFIEYVGVRNLIIFGAILVALIIFMIVYHSIKLKIYRQEILDLQNQINGIKTLPLQYRLGRVQSIAKNMPEVAEEYEQFTKDFEKITEFQKNELGVLVNEVDESLFYGKTHGIKKKFALIREMTQRYDHDAKDLLARIEKVTEIENIQRVEIIRVKGKYREVGNEYEKIRVKVEEFVPHALEMFKELDDDFVKLETLMNNQMFADAKNFTEEIENRIDSLQENLKDLPSYVYVVSDLLPSKIDKVDELITSLEGDEYALEEMNIAARRQEVDEQMEESIAHVKNVDIKGAAEVLEPLTGLIEELVIDLGKELDSYKQFKEKWRESYNELQRLTDVYQNTMKEYRRLITEFVIDEEEVVISKKYEEFKQIQKDANDLIEQMESGHFAYANMLEHVENLYDRMMQHDAYLEEFKKQKEDTDTKNQKTEELLENINIVLLEIKSEIKNEHLPLVNDSYRDYIADSYNKVEEIKRFKTHKPVVLNELCAKVEGARDVIYKLYDNVHNMIVTAGMVEDAIVYANRYRSMFLEVNTELTKAEVLFRNGEYRNALQVAVDILERLEPGKYEELIKRKEIKSA
ncbi:septation ring formation regulator EzrA [Catenibacterium mitsuokai]|uniref:septation ring formation regulator EzrA n=1 Tax=Catenibacterium mitsuokai TaxID=100886 RepID=UPI001C233593|nr:septation ring formation regulator EzrA [Catenibacterium mitsuokai]MBU9055987.1 septation ring formation regulator EzrA [Catenibacterium mitsuokai]MCB5427909.1 septation ring formation regulator EzrA [Catenibacterium mitsuokai]